MKAAHFLLLRYLSSAHFALSSIATWLCLQLVALPPAYCECATALGNASTMSKERRERVRKRRGRKGAGEMLMSCPVQYPYLWSGDGSRPPCHTVMQEYMKQWEAPHADHGQPCPLFFLSTHIHTPMQPIHRQHKHFMFG